MSPVGEDVVAGIETVLREIGVGEVIAARCSPWNSANFSGHRVVAVCDFQGDDRWAAGNAFAGAISEDHFAITGGIVADVRVNWSNFVAQRFTCELEVLVLEEA